MTREENLKKFYKEFKGQLPNPVFERMAEEFSRFTNYIGFAIDQESDGSSVDFNFLLPGKILISITGLNDFLGGVEGDENVPELPPEMMSVNIFHDRECLVSDFMILEKVVDYMINVTNKITLEEKKNTLLDERANNMKT